VDAELIGRAQRGDEGAFASLAVAAGNRLHAVAFRILRNTNLAQDATQHALLSIWQDLPQLRDPARFDPLEARAGSCAARLGQFGSADSAAGRCRSNRGRAPYFEFTSATPVKIRAVPTSSLASTGSLRTRAPRVIP
jgi:hypothetical protein